jgi:NAD(P)-dependent dehydrogenase (short-subunit alcohol dehydrogenase family)
VATARDPRSLADLVALGAFAVQLDVTRPAEIASATAAAIQRFGAIDVLVNNAGYSIVGAVEETSEAELRAVFEPMFFGPVALIRALLPHFRERRTGTIVNITSVGGLTVSPGFGPYCAVKHALEAMSEALAGELVTYGVKVLIVEPGAFRTKLFGGGFREMPETAAYEASAGQIRKWVADQDGKQAGDPDKAARAIVAAVANPLTLRLPLGADAVQNIREKLGRVSGEIDRVAAMASATAF